jgi:Ni,Fe-hydrogenase III large subunit
MSAMSTAFPTLRDLVAAGRRIEAHAPWPRAIVNAEQWHGMTTQLTTGRWTLVSLWGEPDAVHAALREENAVAVLSLACPDGSFPSVGRAHPPAARLERTIGDLFGLVARGATDVRPWLDHGRWPVRHPLATVVRSPEPHARYEYLPAEGDGLHLIPVGPVHAGIIEPGHFRFTVNGEAVVRLEERLGYVHKGVDSLMRGQTIDAALRIAARISGDSTVAYALAFSRAVEAALGIGVPPRAHAVRAVMAELERLANHCGDIGAICNDATFTIMHAHCGVLREQVLRAADVCFGHRLMMDRIAPGGVTADLAAAGIAALRALLEVFRQRFPRLVGLYDNTASLQDRTVTTGVLRKSLAAQYGAGGFVGRASGLAFDARKAIGYAPYDRVAFEVPTFAEGDVNARVWMRIREVEQSLKLIEQLIAALPEGPGAVTHKPNGGGEGAALVEGFRGDVFAWVRIGDDGTVERCHLRDPSWFQWPLLEAAIEGNIVADFPLCNKSFNCSYSGHDL